MKSFTGIVLVSLFANVSFAATEADPRRISHQEWVTGDAVLTKAHVELHDVKERIPSSSNVSEDSKSPSHMRRFSEDNFKGGAIFFVKIDPLVAGNTRQFTDINGVTKTYIENLSTETQRYSLVSEICFDKTMKTCAKTADIYELLPNTYINVISTLTGSYKYPQAGTNSTFMSTTLGTDNGAFAYGAETTGTAVIDDLL